MQEQREFLGPWTCRGPHLANVRITPILQTREWAEQAVLCPAYLMFTVYSVPGMEFNVLPDLAPPLAPHHPRLSALSHLTAEKTGGSESKDISVKTHGQ